jgi:hypothetical protein
MPPRGKKRARTSTDVQPQQSSDSLLLAAADDHADSLRTTLSAMWQQDKLCDVTVEVKADGRTFRAHRNVLAAESAFFMGMLTGDYSESSAAHITLHDEQASIFECALHFMYNRTCSLSTANELQPLLECACRLQITSLQAVAETAVIGRLTSDNALAALSIADHLSLPDLARAAKKVVSDDFSAVLASGAIKELSAELLGELLSSEDLGVTKEEHAFEAVVAWVDGQSHPPSPEVTEGLLARVRFPLMPSEYVRTVVEPHALVLAHPRVVISAFREAFNKEDTPRTRQRRGKAKRWRTVAKGECVADGQVVRLNPDVDELNRYLSSIAIDCFSREELVELTGMSFVWSEAKSRVQHVSGPCPRSECRFCLCEQWSYAGVADRILEVLDD